MKESNRFAKSRIFEKPVDHLDLEQLAINCFETEDTFIKFGDLPIILKRDLKSNKTYYLFGLKECVDHVTPMFSNFIKKHFTPIETMLEFNHPYARAIY